MLKAILKIQNLLILFLTSFACLSPWLYDAKYNQDLLILVIYLNTVYENITLFEAIGDNSFYTFVIGYFLKYTDPKTLIFVCHNISVVVFTYTLKKYFRSNIVLSIMFLTFFTFFLNQFRLILGLSLALYALSEIKSNNLKKGILLLVLAGFVHLLSIIWFVPLILIELFKEKSLRVKIRFGLILVVFGALVLSKIHINERFNSYLNESTEYISYTFVVTTFIFLLLFKDIDNKYKYYLTAIIIINIILFRKPLLSSRMAELLILTIPLCAPINDKKKELLLYGTNRIVPYLIMFIVCLLFFIYRFYNWFVLDKVIRPEILDNLYYSY